MRWLFALTLVVSGIAASSSSTGASRPPGLTFTHLIRSRSGVDSVWVADADGSHAREVSRDGFGSKLSSDGRWLTFDRFSAGPGSDFSPLFVVDLTTGKTRPLGKTTGDECWSPIRPEFAVSQPGGLYLVDAASGLRTKLLSAKVSSCDFTPDGNSIVLALGSLDERTSSPPSDLFLLRLSDHSLRRLT